MTAVAAGDGLAILGDATRRPVAATRRYCPVNGSPNRTAEASAMVADYTDSALLSYRNFR
jgi:hypothetical protein